MKSFWLDRRSRRNTVGKINSELKKYVGLIYDDVLLDKMRQTVLIYFKFHQDEFQLFLDAAGGLDYQFDVAMDSTGKLKVILFVPTNHRY